MGAKQKLCMVPRAEQLKQKQERKEKRTKDRKDANGEQARWSKQDSGSVVPPQRGLFIMFGLYSPEHLRIGPRLTSAREQSIGERG